MSFIDVILGIPILFFAFRGFLRGFIKTLASFAGLIIAIIGTIYFSDITATVLKDYFQLTFKFMPIIAFIATFLVIIFVVNFAGRILKNLIHFIHLGCIDKILGLVLGGLTTVFILSLAVNAFDYLNNRFQIITDATKEASFLYNIFNYIAKEFYEWFDFNFWEWSDKIMEKSKKIEEKII